MNETLQQIKERFQEAVAVESGRDGDVVVMADTRSARGALLEVIGKLRDLGFTVLTDLAGIDYLQYPIQQPGRFAVTYILSDLKRRQRVRLKAYVGAQDPVLPSVTHLWQAANWLERECWDQFGIRFEGHPNLKRLLNHHEFVGHPLRKDYPMRSRQPLSENDSLMDEMVVRLRQKGLLLPGIEAQLATPGVRVSDHGEEAAPGSPSFGARGGAASAAVVERITALPGVLGEPEFYRDLHTELMFLNIGPSHPATHGTLRALVALDGETIMAAVGEIGYLHRGFEKSTEVQTYNGVIPYTDRLNYVSAMMNNFAYCKTIEKMLGIETTDRTKAIRVVIAELSRIIDHLVCIGANLVDLGALTNYWYLFNVREKAYDIFDRLTGARLTNSYGRVGGVARDFYPGCGDDILRVLKEAEKAIADVEQLISHNRILLDRLTGISKVNSEEALSRGWTGPLLRASGVEYDVRKAFPYDGYEQYDFEIPIGTVGDTYDRFFIRFYEMAQSARIIRQALANMPAGPIFPDVKTAVLPPKDDTYNNIEGLMNHFKLVFEGVKVPPGELYDSYEAANGELGFFVVADGSGKPYRNRCRPPSLLAYAAFPEIIEGHMIADAIATLGGLNIIAGELDR